jgi:hypothetical protein
MINIRPKRSNTPGSVPTSGQLVEGEIAINIPDQKIYVKDSTGDVVLLTTGDLSTYATLSYVDTSISNLIDSAPGALDTLNELAAALGDDPNFATTVTNSIATKWTQDNTKISDWDAAYGWGDHGVEGYATTTYVDDQIAGITIDSLGDISDVNITNPQNNDNLIYNGYNGKWENRDGIIASTVSTEFLTVRTQAEFLGTVFGKNIQLSGSLAVNDIEHVATINYVDDQIAALDLYTDADVDAHLNTSTATTNQLLSWTGSDYAWVDDLTGTEYTDADAVDALETASQVTFTGEINIDSANVTDITRISTSETSGVLRLNKHTGTGGAIDDISVPIIFRVQNDTSEKFLAGINVQNDITLGKQMQFRVISDDGTTGTTVITLSQDGVRGENIYATGLFGFEGGDSSGQEATIFEQISVPDGSGGSRRALLFKVDAGAIANNDRSNIVFALVDSSGDDELLGDAGWRYRTNGKHRFDVRRIVDPEISPDTLMSLRYNDSFLFALQGLGVGGPQLEWRSDRFDFINYTGRMRLDAGSDIRLQTSGGNVTLECASSGKNIILNNLPTSDPAVANAVWNDGGTLKISAG